MDFDTTLIATVIAAVVFIAANLLGRKAEPLSPLAYIPWTGIQFVAVVAVFVLGAHLYSEWRGEPLIGTRNPLRGL